MQNTNNSLTAVAPQEGPSVSVVGDTYRIVIGSEQTNGTYALRLAKNTFSVALVENELVGGDCAYWACIPSVIKTPRSTN